MFPKPAGSLVRYLPLFRKKKHKVVLDYGAGNLRNSVYMHRQGFEVYAVDLPNGVKQKPLPRLSYILPEEVKILKRRVDVVICTYVLNLMSEKDRRAFMDSVVGRISPEGYMLIETRGLSQFDLDMMVLPKGFIRIDAGRGRYTLIALYQYHALQTAPGDLT